MTTREQVEAALRAAGFVAHDEDPANRMFRAVDGVQVVLSHRRLPEGTCRVDADQNAPGERMTYGDLVERLPTIAGAGYRK